MNWIFTSHDLWSTDYWWFRDVNRKLRNTKFCWGTLLKKTSLLGNTQHKEENVNSWRSRTKTASIQTAIIILITAAMFNEGTILTPRCVPNTSIRYYSPRAATSRLPAPRKSWRLWDDVRINVVERDKRMRIACWVSKATDAHSECRTLTALPQQ